MFTKRFTLTTLFCFAALLPGHLFADSRFEDTPFPQAIHDRTTHFFGKEITRGQIGKAYSSVFSDGSLKVELVTLNETVPYVISEDEIAMTVLDTSIPDCEIPKFYGVSATCRHLYSRLLFGFKVKFLDEADNLRGETLIALSPRYTPENVDHFGRNVAPELKLWNVRIQPVEQRQGFSRRFLGASIQLLQGISRNPEARIKITAYTDAFTDPSSVGAYVWARLGFEFLDDPYQPGLSSQPDLLRNVLASILKEHGNELSLSEWGRLRTTFEGFKYPWEFADYDASQQFEKVKAESGDARWGKTALLGGFLQWEGILFVNQAESPGMTRFSQF